MKIALVILHADSAMGGAEIYTVNLAQSLLERGHEVSLLASSFGENLPAARRVRLEASGWTRLGGYVSFLKSLERELARDPHDIVHAMLPVPRCAAYHTHSGLAAQGVDEGYLRYNHPVRRLLSKWGTRLNRKRCRFAQVEREMMAGPDAPTMLCLTDAIKRAADGYFPARADRIVKLFYGIDLSRFDPQSRPGAGIELRRRLNIAEDRVVALNIGQDFERKGVRESIATIAAVNDPRLILLVAGRDDPRPYQAFARSVGVGDRVIFAGPTRDVYAFYQASDFFLFPSRVEPCGLVVLESAAMGRPVIVTRQAGAHEVITPARHGFVVDDPRDVPGMAAAARQLLDADARRRMGQACLELRPMLSQQRHVDELLAIYQARLSNKTPRAK